MEGGFSLIISHPSVFSDEVRDRGREAWSMLAQFKDHHVQFLFVGIQLRCEVEGEFKSHE